VWKIKRRSSRPIQEEDACIRPRSRISYLLLCSVLLLPAPLRLMCQSKARGREKKGAFYGPFPCDNLDVRDPCHKSILVPIPPAHVPSIDNLEASNQNEDGKL
jgi:hypothetical protein